MFVIVHNNFVVWGPKNWNKLGFEDVLRTDCEIEYSLPSRNDAQVPFVISENTRILRVEDGERPEIDPLFQRLNGPYWEFHDDHAVSNFVAEELPIDFIKGTLKGIVASNRYNQEVGGFKMIVRGENVSIDTSREGRNIYFNTLMAMDETETIDWKFSDRWLSLQKIDLAEIVLAGKNHIKSAFDWEASKIVEIDQATTINQLKAISLNYGS